MKITTSTLTISVTLLIAMAAPAAAAAIKPVIEVPPMDLYLPGEDGYVDLTPNAEEGDSSGLSALTQDQIDVNAALMQALVEDQ